MNRRVTAFEGSQYIPASSAQTGKNYYGFMVQEDTVIGTLAGGDRAATSTNWLTTMGLSGVTLKQGALILVPEGKFIANLTVTSGSVIAYS